MLPRAPRACILRPNAVIGCKCPVSGMLRKPIFIYLLPQDLCDIWCLTLTDTSTLRPRFYCTVDEGSKPAPRLQNRLYRLSSVRNDLQIAEFFEPVFTEFNAKP
jgi:hypothetical protein